ncbi:hypothetical protein GWR56_13655 [Mucilaginibacter sp. 14171R-50]|uniref:hypothetical protein n=1 Tax=Mucilaginibacter sp. 14171R-50 TaxID=2703789 RepID=UPI00138B4A8B|nr:hypothetical protein [Mucilaginibacter sp. 14171R-50]QHS56534.1 hypothetical protein GWR56_13655 [Mucilaginibacter sp. 14171R-50]
MKFIVIVSLILSGYLTAKGQNCPPPPKGWSIKICIDRTEANSMKLEYRIGGCDDCAVFEKTWHRGELLEWQLPVQIRYAREIWIRATTGQNRKEIHLCLLFNGQSVREIKCNGNPETHDSEWTDRRHCACNP